MTRMLTALAVIICMVGTVFAGDDARTFGPQLQDLSVNIKTSGGEGSGVIITREHKDADGKPEHISFIWTAGHVVKDLRSTRSVIDSRGNSKQIIEFKDAAIVKEATKNGRRVGESKMDVRVIKYSDPDDGEDLALLQVIAPDFSDKNTVFYLKDKAQDEIVPVGTTLYHVGCLYGQMGANSFTTGVMSQTGRVNDKHVYDQTSVTAFPGSSGGGVWMVDSGKPVYVGMLVRGAGETFNLVVPIRRIHNFAKKYKLEWALNDKVACPSQADLDKIAIEESGIAEGPGAYSSSKKPDDLIPTPPVAPHAMPKVHFMNRMDSDLPVQILPK